MIVIAGPCVVESLDSLKRIAFGIKSVISKYKDLDFYFKASCKKDNRTSVKNYCGVGFLQGIDFLKQIKNEFNFKITTDFHCDKDVAAFGKDVDLIQIPAFLCCQTSLLRDVLVCGKPIHIKKGQFLGPKEFVNSSVKKYKELWDNADKLIITDRGTCFGYNMLIMDPRHVLYMKESGAKVLVDVTHPNKNYIEKRKDRWRKSNILATSYIASGADGFFAEIHENPSAALCDSETMITIPEFEKILEHSHECYKIKEKQDAKYK